MSSQDLLKNHKRRVLSLDGGGMRGFSSLLILQQIFHVLNVVYAADNRHWEPWMVFDLIGGTSTGGIIAIMLGRLRMSIKDCVDKYRELGSEVFSGTKRFLHKNKYRAEDLANVMTQVIEENVQDQQALFLNARSAASDRPCHTVVFSLPDDNVNRHEPIAHRSYVSSEAVETSVTILEAARSTSAAVTFLEPLQLSDQTSRFVDAGIKFNNPASYVKEEMIQTFRPRSVKTGFQRFDYQQLGCFISVGTGVPARIAAESDATLSKMAGKVGLYLHTVKALQQIATDTERENTLIYNEFRNGGYSDLYYRFNVEHGLQYIKLDASDQLGAIRTATDEYLSKPEIKQKIEKLVESIRAMLEAEVVAEGAIDLNAQQGLHASSAYGEQLTLEERLVRLRQCAPNRQVMNLHTKLRHDRSLLRDGKGYFEHMTAGSYGIYEDLYDWINSQEPAVSGVHILDFGKCLGSFIPHDRGPARLIEMWQRLRWDPTQRLPKGFALAILYMIHIEWISSTYCNERPTSPGMNRISNGRLKQLRASAHWIQCCPGENQCRLEWNFIDGVRGLCRHIATSALHHDSVPDVLPLQDSGICLLYDRFWHKSNGERGMFVEPALSDSDHEKAQSKRESLKRKWLAMASHD